MIKGTVIFVIAAILISSCKQEEPVAANKSISVDSISGTQLKFDSCMEKLMAKYHHPKEYEPTPGKQYHDSYELVKRVYLPGLRNLTFDCMQFGLSTDFNFPVIFIYNDTFQFVLPFMDFDYFRTHSDSKFDSVSTNNVLSLSNEFNILKSKLMPLEGHEQIHLSDVIMSFFNAERVSGTSGIEMLRAKTNYYLNERSLYPNCIASINSNTKRIETEIKGSSLVYVNGLMAFVFGKNQNGSDTIVIINTDCAIDALRVYN